MDSRATPPKAAERTVESKPPDSASPGLDSRTVDSTAAPAPDSVAPAAPKPKLKIQQLRRSRSSSSSDEAEAEGSSSSDEAEALTKPKPVAPPKKKMASAKKSMASAKPKSWASPKPKAPAAPHPWSKTTAQAELQKMGGIDEAPHDIENPKDPLLEELHNLFRLSPSRCIYRVPERLRQGNEKAYTPQVVSIGPLHHGKEHLKAMEEHKKRYLGHFLSRTREWVSFSDYIKMIKDQEGRLRGCYAEPIEFGSDEFVRIVLVDAAFIIELLMRFYFSDSQQDEDDYMFNTPEMFWDVRPDLRLLENQLPFFILQDLLKIRCPSSHQQPLLLNISYKFFESEIDSKGKEEKFKQICSFGDVQHFVDLIRILYQPLKSKQKTEKENTTPTPNVTELRQAGVKFVVGTGSDLFDIKFSSGKLEIPKLTVNDTTDLTLRNLLAFEQCHHREENYLTNYVVLMMRLVKTPKDVDLLVEKEIIENWLGDTQKISTLLHDLGNGVMVSNHYYAPLCEELHNYCSNRHKYMANLRQNYFDTPWSTISVVAAGILLILTFLQTVCSIISVA